MDAKLISFVRNNWLLVSLTLVVFLAAVWFGTQFLRDFLYFNDPNNVDVDLKGWMTPRFIVLTYDLPRTFVAELLELTENEGGGQRLSLIADELGISLEELTQKVRDAAAQYRSETQ